MSGSKAKMAGREVSDSEYVKAQLNLASMRGALKAAQGFLVSVAQAVKDLEAEVARGEREVQFLTKGAEDAPPKSEAN